jgi:hypothetical protein
MPASPDLLVIAVHRYLNVRFGARNASPISEEQELTRDVRPAAVLGAMRQRGGRSRAGATAGHDQPGGIGAQLVGVVG